MGVRENPVRLLYLQKQLDGKGYLSLYLGYVIGK